MREKEEKEVKKIEKIIGHSIYFNKFFSTRNYSTSSLYIPKYVQQQSPFIQLFFTSTFALYCYTKKGFKFIIYSTSIHIPMDTHNHHHIKYFLLSHSLFTSLVMFSYKTAVSSTTSYEWMSWWGGGWLWDAEHISYPLREMVIIFVSFRIYPIIAFTMFGKKEKLLPHFCRINWKLFLFTFIFHFPPFFSLSYSSTPWLFTRVYFIYLLIIFRHWN